MRAHGILLLLLLAIPGCNDSSQPMQPPDGPSLTAAVAAETETIPIKLPLDYDDFVPCTGENVHWTGTLRMLFHFLNNRGVDPSLGQQHYIDNESLHLIGIGELSGGTYRLNNVQRFGGHSEDPVDPFPVTSVFVRRDVVIGPDGGAVGQLNWDFTVVINGTGEAVLFTETFDVVCR